MRRALLNLYKGIVIFFNRNSIVPPENFNYLIDNDGDYIVDNDGDYLVEVK